MIGGSSTVKWWYLISSGKSGLGLFLIPIKETRNLIDWFLIT